MKNIALASVFILFLTGVSGQSLASHFEVSSGPVDESYNPPDIFLGRDHKGNMVYFQSKYGLYGIGMSNFLWYYDTRLNRVRDSKIEWDKEVKDPGSSFRELSNPKGLVIGNNRFLIRSHVSDRDQTLFLNAYRFDPERSDLILYKKIASLKAGKYRYKHNYFDIAVSPDSSRIAFYKRIEEQGNNGAKGYYFIVTDRDFTVLWKDDVLIPIDEDQIQLLSVVVSNAGEVHALVKEYFQGRNERRNGEINYTFHVFSRASTEAKTQRYEYKLDEEKFISSPVIAVDPDNRMVLAGFYGKRRPQSFQPTLMPVNTVESIRQDGVFIAPLGGGKPIYYEFDATFLTSTMTENRADRVADRMEEAEKSKKNDRFNDRNYRIQQIVSDGKGGFYLIGEKYWVTSHTDSKGNTYYNYHHGELVLIRFGSDNQVRWAKKLYKYFVESTPGIEHVENVIGVQPFHITLVRPDALYCLYEDDKDNFDNRAESAFDQLLGFQYALWCARFDAETGEMKKEQIEANKERKGFVSRFNSTEYDGKDIYFFGSKQGFLGTRDTRMKKIEVKL